MHHLCVMDGFFPPLGFFGIGDSEMLLIMVAILIFFGGEKMPELARGLGKALREFKRATSEVEREFKRVMEEAENPPTTFPSKYTPPADSLPTTPGPEALPAGDNFEAGQLPTTPEAAIPESNPAPTPPEASNPAKEHEGDFHSDV